MAKKMGVAHHAWSSEATVNLYRWHVHRHALIFSTVPPDQLGALNALGEFRLSMFDVLGDGLLATGWDPQVDGVWQPEVGLHMEVVHDEAVGSYLVKLAGPAHFDALRTSAGQVDPAESILGHIMADGIDPCAIPFALAAVPSAWVDARLALGDPQVSQLARWWWEWRQARRGTRLVQYSRALRRDLIDASGSPR